jgi:hypothetical protein
MFDAYRTARDTVQAAIESNHTAILQAVSKDAQALRDVYRVTAPRNIVFPCCIIGQARGDVDDSPSRSTRTRVTLPVMIALSGSDPERLDAEMDAQITAMVRLFAGTQHGEMLFSVEDFDADMPAPFEANLVQTAVVTLSATVTESR